jgi:hypothetical protein
MYGIQVNIGTVPKPDWRWIYGNTMKRTEFQTESEAKAHLVSRYSILKSQCFRVRKLDEEVEE